MKRFFILLVSFGIAFWESEIRISDGDSANYPAINKYENNVESGLTALLHICFKC